MGSTESDDKDMKVLNMIMRITDKELLHGPYPRHVDMLLLDLGPDAGNEAKPYSTTGGKHKK